MRLIFDGRERRACARVSAVTSLARVVLLSPLMACSAAEPSAGQVPYTDSDSLPKDLPPRNTSQAADPAITASNVVSEKPAIGKERLAILSAPLAIAAFQAAWTEEVLPLTKGRTRPDVAQYSAAVAETKRHAARRVECRAGHRRVDNTLGGSERTDLVFFSSIAAVDRDGECWEVTVSTGAFNEIVAYFDPATGALLLVWLVPEG